MNTIPRSHGQEIVPRGMEQYDQFILCKVIPDATRPGKTVKLPCDIHSTTVSALERRNWMSAATAIETAARHGLRVGFVFAECDPFWLIDLDGCYDPGTGLWSPLARAPPGPLPRRAPAAGANPAAGRGFGTPRGAGPRA